jgi:hypothetical protein
VNFENEKNQRLNDELKAYAKNQAKSNLIKTVEKQSFKMIFSRRKKFANSTVKCATGWEFIKNLLRSAEL